MQAFTTPSTTLLFCLENGFFIPLHLPHPFLSHIFALHFGLGRYSWLGFSPTWELASINQTLHISSMIMSKPNASIRGRALLAFRCLRTCFHREIASIVCAQIRETSFHQTPSLNRCKFVLAYRRNCAAGHSQPTPIPGFFSARCLFPFVKFIDQLVKWINGSNLSASVFLSSE